MLALDDHIAYSELVRVAADDKEVAERSFGRCASREQDETRDERSQVTDDADEGHGLRRVARARAWVVPAQEHIGRPRTTTRSQRGFGCDQPASDRDETRD